MDWTKMLDVLYDYGIKKKLVVYWDNGEIFSGFSEGINETSNCWDDNSVDYYMCVFRITDIIKEPNDAHAPVHKTDDLVELSTFYEPIKIESDGKDVLWEISNDRA